MNALCDRERPFPYDIPSPHKRDALEIQLLFCLARANLASEDAARLELILQEPVAWHEFLRLAERHRVLPLCARHLNKLAPDRVPPAAMDAMREYSERNLRRSLLLTGELRMLLQLFEENAIDGVAYKGPVLAQEIYGSVALRDMLDLDILVFKHEALRARQLLFERGYQSVLPAGSDAYLLWSGCNFPLVNDANGFVVELHWAPETCLSERKIAELWQRLEHVSLAGMQVQTFCRQDLLVLLCLHGCRHMWERLEWIAVIAELLRTTDLAWSELLELARSIGGKRAVLLGVSLAHEFLDAPVPGHILQQAHADRQIDRLAQLCWDHIFSQPPVLAHRLGIPFHTFQLRAKERLRDRVGYTMRRALAPSRRFWQSAQFDVPWLMQESSIGRSSAGLHQGGD